VRVCCDMIKVGFGKERGREGEKWRSEVGRKTKGGTLNSGGKHPKI